MARLSDLGIAIHTLGFRRFVLQLWAEIVKDKLTTQAAAVAYAWLFAVFPFLLFLLTLFAYIPERQKVDATQYVSTVLHRVMAHEAAKTMDSNLTEVLNEPRSGLLSVGLVVTLWIASGGMAMTMTALDAAFDAPKPRPFYTQRPIAMLLTIVVTALVMVVFLLLPVGSAIERWLAATARVPSQVLWALTFTRYILAILLMFANLCLLYTFGTRVRHKFAFFSPGAIFTVIVWIVLGEGFRLYVDKFGRYQKTYGAVGGVTIILLFFYLDALVMLIGAEINSQVDRVAKEKTLF